MTTTTPTTADDEEDSQSKVPYIYKPSDFIHIQTVLDLNQSITMITYNAAGRGLIYELGSRATGYWQNPFYMYPKPIEVRPTDGTTNAPSAYVLCYGTYTYDSYLTGQNVGLSIEFTLHKVLCKSFAIKSGNNYSAAGTITKLLFEGSEDGKTWTQLHETDVSTWWTTQPFVEHHYYLPENSSFYSHYRWYMPGCTTANYSCKCSFIFLYSQFKKGFELFGLLLDK